MDTNVRVDRYQRYKKGTAAVLVWLVNAGRTCGLVHESSRSASSRKYTLSLDQYTNLATHVADQSSVKLQVSPELLELLRDAISLRKEANRFFEANAFGDENEQEKNEGHRYAIAAFETIAKKLERLKGAKVAQRTPLKDGQVRTKHELPTSNVFNGLDVEDLSDPVGAGQQPFIDNESKALALSAKGRKSKPSRDARNYTPVTAADIEFESSEDDLFLLLFCFYKDLGEVRNYLAGLWHQYHENKVPLVSAAVTTDLAFDVCRRQEEQFLETEVFIGGKMKTLRDAYAEIASRQKESAVCRYWRPVRGEDEGIDSALLRHWSLADLLFDYIYNLGWRIDSNDELRRAAFHDRMCGVIDWLGLSSFAYLDFVETVMCQREQRALPHINLRERPSEALKKLHHRFEYDFGGLVLLVPSLQVYHNGHDDDGPPRDVFTMELMRFVTNNPTRTRKAAKAAKQGKDRVYLHSWFIWATTVFLDINARMTSDTEFGFRDLQALGAEVQSTYHEVMEWSEQNPDPDLNQPNLNKRLKVVSSCAEHYVEGDIIADLNEKLSEIDGGVRKHTPHYLLRRNPIWCGVLAFWMQTAMYLLGVRMVNCWVVVFSCMHLYNMCFHEAKVAAAAFKWPDMEYLIDVYTPEHLFCGSRPNTAHQYIRRFWLAFGMPTRNGRRDHISDNSIRRRERRFRPDAIASTLLSRRYKIKDTDIELPGTDMSSLEILFEFQRRPGSKALVPKDRDVIQCVDLLTTVQRTLASDWRHLTFNYCTMHMRCWDLLRRIQVEMGANDRYLEFAVKTDNNDFEDEHQDLQSNPLRILTVVDLEAGNKGARSASLKEARRRVARMAIDVVSTYAKEMGDVGVKEAMDHLPEIQCLPNGNELTMDWIRSTNDQALATMRAAASANGQPADDKKIMRKLFAGIEAATTEKSQIPGLNGATSDAASVSSGIAQKKKNNKNKNKNRKLRQKQERAAESSQSMTSGKELVGPVDIDIEGGTIDEVQATLLRQMGIMKGDPTPVEDEHAGSMMTTDREMTVEEQQALPV